MLPGATAGLYPLLYFWFILGILDLGGRENSGRTLPEVMLTLKATSLAWRKELYPGLGGGYPSGSRGSTVNQMQATLNGFPL